VKDIYEFAYASRSKLLPKRSRRSLLADHDVGCVDAVRMMQAVELNPGRLVPRSAFANLIK
jgi:hypothetical protein